MTQPRTAATILVVEDSPTQARRLKFLLERHGYSADVCADGREALDYLTGRPPALIISDIIMPEIQGFHLCRMIKADARTRHIPVVLLTSLAHKDDVLESLDCGADGFISKPYSENHLISCITGMLQHTPEERVDRRIDLFVPIAGRMRKLTVDPRRMLNLLLSTYEAAMVKNSDLIVAQEELQDMNENLEELVEERTEELRQLNETKDRFFSIIAHDLRNAFGGLMSAGELMTNLPDDMEAEEIRLIAHTMGKTVKNVHALFENLLEWSMMQRGVVVYQPHPINLGDLVSSVRRSQESAASAKHIAIECTVPRNIMVHADLRMAETVLRNLISNAVKFTHIGGRVLITAETIRDGHARISVRDSGIGISADNIGKLFHLDARVNRPGTAGEPSTGLGLILCKEFVERHGGTIEVESTVGSGSTFAFTLPSIEIPD